MKRFIINPHVADVRLELEGSNLEELFTAAMQGMTEFIKPGSCASNNDLVLDLVLQKELEIKAIDTTMLLVDFMSDILTVIHIEKAVFCAVTFSKLTETELQATIFGKKVESFDEDVKAITYHEAEVKKNASGNYETTIVFDI